jgi:hypothetical protein
MPKGTTSIRATLDRQQKKAKEKSEEQPEMIMPTRQKGEYKKSNRDLINNSNDSASSASSSTIQKTQPQLGYEAENKPDVVGHGGNRTRVLRRKKTKKRNSTRRRRRHRHRRHSRKTFLS